MSVDSFEKVLSNRISQVWYSDHILDNSFLSFSVEETLKNMQRLHYQPIGVCLDPPIAGGIALVFETKNFEQRWVHVGSNLMFSWLRELDMLPPADVVWDWDVIQKYVWNIKKETCVSEIECRKERKC